MKEDKLPWYIEHWSDDKLPADYKFVDKDAEEFLSQRLHSTISKTCRNKEASGGYSQLSEKPQDNQKG